MPAKSKSQQRFFGMVRAAQKGDLKDPSSEVADVADDISVKDAKKFAKTKHKGLPEKVKSEGVTYGYKGKRYKKLPAHVKTPAGWGNDDRGELGKAKDAITDKLGITNTKKHGVLAKEDKLAESDVPRNSMGKPIRIKDKIKAAKGFIPHKGKPTVDEGVGRAAIGAGVGAMVGGPVGAAAGAAIGASLGKKKVSSGAGGKKKLTNFFKAEPKVTRRESVEIKESVMDLVRKYSKKKEEKQPQKAMDAGARAKRKLARREYRSKVGAIVPSELEDQKSWLDFTGHFHI